MDSFIFQGTIIILIDCTGLMAGQPGPSSMDKIVDVKLGRDYIPTLIFPNGGWTVGDMGKIIDVQVYW